MTPRQIMNNSDGELWAGCPAELLYIISLLNKALKSDASPLDIEKNIVPALKSFSPIKWAVSSENPCLMKSRYHLASVYKEAVSIYLSQIMHGTIEDSLSETLIGGPVTSALLHIQSIDQDDEHFKCLIWPAFVIGAEARNESQRATIV
ncbi:hypothetical protein N7532_010021 [Penicillium argentinense]|uniref:Uncharacterized protein n=1 Tax=Penicillium argentinense TaxID=1131581 RepID=A0A9W9ENZ3_9EURO|nr:uncharacterized protein N7532_010021 [Penicillium argentinense]KAJ5085250.1 hypothetical protein N7532_010021 [Penicillium argentinense]